MGILNFLHFGKHNVPKQKPIPGTASEDFVNLFETYGIGEKADELVIEDFFTAHVENDNRVKSDELQKEIDDYLGIKNNGEHRVFIYCLARSYVIVECEGYDKSAREDIKGIVSSKLEAMDVTFNRIGMSQKMLDEFKMRSCGRDACIAAKRAENRTGNIAESVSETAGQNDRG